MMRISRIEVDNFKSLVGFSMDLPKFTCLIGLNGAGKSTILQFLDFLSRLVVRDGIRTWLDERGWKPDELRHQLSRREYISFAVHFIDEQEEVNGVWRASFAPELLLCFDESIEIAGSALSTEAMDILTVQTKESASETQRINFDYEGSILSQVKEDQLPKAITRVKKLIASIQSLDLLAPDHLRRRARESNGTLGMGGRNLSAFIFEMSPQDRTTLMERMRKVYPRLKKLIPSSLQSGWKQLEVMEDLTDAPEERAYLRTEARHINDGMLRVLAILAEIQSSHAVAIFDEIENGINPELVEFIVDALARTSKQIIVTTHSPMILNYLEDEVAKESVFYIHKTRGRTRAIPFFSIPSIGEKLRFMGPGEAFVDTDLLRLGEEIDELREAR